MFERRITAPWENAAMMNTFARAPIHFVRLCVLLLPAALLACAALRDPEVNWILWMGSAFLVGVCFLNYLNSRSWRQPLAPSIITLYLIGLGWIWFGTKQQDWYAHLSMAILLIVPLIFFGIQSLIESGATR